MNELQHIDESKYGPVLITLNPPFEPKPELIAGKWRYEHPVLNNDAVRAQREMTSIQGVSGISFAGAYLRYGFHEDGFTSGLKAAAALPSVRPPFEITCANKVYKCGGSIGADFLHAIFEVEYFYGRWQFVKLFSLLFVLAVERYIWGGLSWSDSES
ncbi:hypothetical protein H0H93_004471 [Arthromyces matolae]|nr:hypothetical protein H0H93_004471 [Arthromyces matolae]